MRIPVPPCHTEAEIGEREAVALIADVIHETRGHRGLSYCEGCDCWRDGQAVVDAMPSIIAYWWGPREY